MKLVKFCQICVKILTKFAKFTREIRTKIHAINSAKQPEFKLNFS